MYYLHMVIFVCVNDTWLLWKIHVGSILKYIWKWIPNKYNTHQQKYLFWASYFRESKKLYKCEIYKNCHFYKSRKLVNDQKLQHKIQEIWPKFICHKETAMVLWIKKKLFRFCLWRTTWNTKLYRLSFIPL